MGRGVVAGWSPAELAAVPPGVQPVTADGLLVCLECGRAYRQLGQHVVAAHQLLVGQYRADHGLPAGYSLHCEQTRRARAERGRELWQQDPALRQRLRPTSTTAAERVELARRARTATAGRAGVLASSQAAGRAASAGRVRKADLDYQRRAAELGFPGVTELLAAAQGLPAHDVAALLDVSTKAVWSLRARYGLRSTGAGRPPGTTAGQRRRCLECGASFKGLGQHVVMAHGIDMDTYRARHPVNLRDR